MKEYGTRYRLKTAIFVPSAVRRKPEKKKTFSF